MSFGRKSENSNYKLFILKLLTKDENGKSCSPYFSVLAKDDNGKWTETSRETSVAGVLYRVEPKKFNYEGEDILSAQLFLRDDANQENYIADLRYNMLNRSLLNSVLSIEDFSKEVEISLYFNKKKYPSASVTVGGEKIGWKFGVEAQPVPKKIRFKNKDITDFSEIDAFFNDKIVELSETLKGNAPASVSVEDAQSGKAAPVVEEDDDNFL